MSKCVAVMLAAMTLVGGALAGGALVGGCGPQAPKQTTVGRMPKPPREPAAPPKVVKTPIDVALRGSADHALSEALHSSDEAVRYHALEGIRDANGISHRAEIVAALHDPSAKVRFSAAITAGELNLPEAHDVLLGIAEDPSANVRVAVRFALHRLGDTRLSHQLEKMAADPNPLVRGNTAYVLGMMEEPSAMKLLRKLDQDSVDPVRQQAADSMWRLGDADAMQELVGLTLSGHPDDQMIAYMALAMPRNTIVRQHIRAGLVGDDAATADQEKWSLAVPLVASRALGMLGSDEGYGIALKGAGSVDPQLRTLAALAFGAIGRADAQDTLRKLLADPDPNVRIAAATAVLQLREPA